MASPRKVLLDTSFIIAIENRDDPYHERAKSLDREMLDQEAVLVLHWGILLEIGDGYARLNRRSKGIDLIERFESEHGYEIQPITASLLDDAISLYRERSDKEWGMTDCLSFVLMHREGITDALTADVHFRQAGLRALLLNS